jgi:hypothetical protein
LVQSNNCGGHYNGASVKKLTMASNNDKEHLLLSQVLFLRKNEFKNSLGPQKKVELQQNPQGFQKRVLPQWDYCPRP